MEKQYTLGAGFDALTFKVDIGTPGLASTGVYLILDAGQFQKLAESDADSGDVEGTDAEAQRMVGHLLKVRSIVDFINLDQDQWETLCNTVVSELTLSGGQDGVQVFPFETENKTISEDFRWCIIEHLVRIQ